MGKMTDAEQKRAARQFAKYWEDRGYEKGETQPFWLSLLSDVYGVEHPEQYIEFESKVYLDSSLGFIDGYIPTTRVMIEQKSRGKSLTKEFTQSDSTSLNPFQQAKRYIPSMPVDEHPRWVVTCNFGEFLVYNMNKPQEAPERIMLSDLEKEYYRLNFLVNSRDIVLQRELEVSIAAGDIVGKLYNAFQKQYRDPNAKATLHSLNVLCVRLVFCLYAEDSGVFPIHAQFHDYMESFSVSQMRGALLELFKVLDQKIEERDPYLQPELAAFPYVDGELFKKMNIEVPLFTEEIRELLLKDASENFDWSEISPTIFGAVFESTLNQETRRSGGMHYTSIENIHKVIDPLFLDDLRAELDNILAREKGSGRYDMHRVAADPWRRRLLVEFKNKLGKLTFLDPAAGSGNFLTETYLSLRRMENEIIRELCNFIEGQFTIGSVIDDAALGIQVSIDQFYGIEINDFAVSVARTALWIAEHQMMRETSNIINRKLDFLPLKTNAHIVEGNALRLDWETVVPKEHLTYIMGNPPFVGYSLQSREQKKDVLDLWVDSAGKPYPGAGKIDYVAGWYYKASRMMTGSQIRTALVSTNSITQGEQVALVWKPLIQGFRVCIDFAHRTFRWDSEASIKAHVHCVIVGFSIATNNRTKRIYSAERVQEVNNINAYLLDAPDIFVESRKKPLCPVAEIQTGNRPADGGALLIADNALKDFIGNDSEIVKFIRPFMQATDFINNKKKWCLWLVDASPSEIRKYPQILDRINACRIDRLNAPDKGRNKLADTPMLFREQITADNDYIIIPRHTSENRRYIPIGYVDKSVICGDANLMIINTSLYHFGVLISNVHMAWVRAVCGRIKSDYRYSKDVVYNNFPWPTPTEAQRIKIEQTAQAILDARAHYPNSSLADLYDELTMPPDLRKAHQANDRAVMMAYGMSIKETTENSCVAELMRRYEELTKQ